MEIFTAILKLWCAKLLSDPYNPGTVRKIFIPNTGTISKDSMSTPIWKPKLLMPNQLARYSKYIPTEVYLDSYVTSSDHIYKICRYIYICIYMDNVQRNISRARYVQMMYYGICLLHCNRTVVNWALPSERKVT